MDVVLVALLAAKVLVRQYVPQPVKVHVAEDFQSNPY